jgi:polar amino acid transport system substrate-binding protein
MMAERNSIVLGTEDWPPFSYKDKTTKQISGLSTEIINATFKQMGISIKDNRVYPWARAQKWLYEGKIDAVYTASVNDERKRHSYFPAEPIITSKWVLFIKKTNRGILHFDKMSDLKDKRIGLILGYNYPKKFKKYISENSITEEVSLEVQNISKLLMGRDDYMPAVLETTLYLAKNRPDLKELDAYKNLYYFPNAIATTDFYLMFSKKNVSKEFVEKFSKVLIKFKKTDKYKKILKRYL